ncbi:MAG: histidine phosphatase family protein [Anaerolineales bacterium]|nr:histidine phosphatase family protein [Anaerolineales bacterium]
MESRLLLIRHGPSRVVREMPASRWTLTPTAEPICAAFARRHLAPYAPARILTSHEPKAIRTGEIMAAVLDLPCAPAPDLHEHRRETAPWFDEAADFQAAIARLFAHPHDVVFGEESADQARVRFDAGIAALLRQYPHQTLAIVTHGTVLSLFIAAHNNLDPLAFWRQLTMPACAVLALPTFALRQTITA